jgi:hypothetical protein
MTAAEVHFNIIWLNEWMHERGGRTGSFVCISRKGWGGGGKGGVMKQCRTVDAGTQGMHS